MSLQAQFLDVVVVRKQTEAPLPVALPDGFDVLTNYNLISFKSLQESLTP